MRKLLLLSSVLLFHLLMAGDYQIKFDQPASQTYALDFTLFNYQLETEMHQGQNFTHIRFGSGVFIDQKGYARLPYTAVAVQIPAQKNVSIQIAPGDFEDIILDDPLLPSRGTITRCQNPDTIAYTIDPNSITDSWYPGFTAKDTRPFIIKDVRGTSVYFYPFQYNAAQKILRVYKSILVTLTENDTPPINPLTHRSPVRLREMEGIYNSVFVNYRSSSDLSVAQHGDILVITTSRDESAIAPYIQWKREKGFHVEEDVVASGTMVKDIIQQKYDENNNLLYVQLVGDWADVQSERGTSSNLPMDPEMGCVAGDDDFPDISIGRMSANSADQVTTQVNKILTYEKYPQSGGSWYSTATGIASDQGPGDDNEYDYEHEDVIWNDKLDPFTYSTYHAIYDPSASKNDVSNAVNNGTGILNYTGHGSSTSWGTTGFSNSDVNNLTNGDLLPFIFSVACNNGEFDQSSGDCFAEAWLKKENGGAIMFLGSTISQPWDPPMRGQDYFNDVLIGGYNYDDHSGQNGINTHEQRTMIGSIVVNGFDLMLSESDTDDDKNTVDTWTLFGDPAMQVRTAAPAALSLSNETVMAGQDFSTTVTSDGQAVEGAMVTLSQDGNYFSGITDSDGQVTLSHTLQTGDALLVVTAFNTETVYETVTVQSADGPWITVADYSIDDASTGNGNGQAEFDESVLLSVDAQNSGNQPAYGVNALLSSADSYVSISDSTHFYGDIAVDQTVAAPDAFAMQFANNVPDQHTVDFNVKFTDNQNGSWNSTISIIVNAPAFSTGSLSVDDSQSGNNNGRLDAGENADLIIPTSNSGHAAAEHTSGSLSTSSQYLTINSTTYDLGTLAVDDTVNATFSVSASESTPPGTTAEVYYQVTSGAYSSVDTFYLSIGDLPVYIMADTTVYVQDGLFYDTGGADGEYQNKEKITMTFFPADRAPAVKAHFTSFTLSDLDQLYIYDGPDKNAPQVAGSPFSTTNSPGEVIATNAQGALTFYFESNIIYTEAGWEAEVSSTAVSETESSFRKIPQTFALLGNFPNPFNPSTTIEYQLPEAVHVQISVYNILGQLVKTLTDTKQQSGTCHVLWDGKDSAGRTMPSGLYLYRLDAGTFHTSGKMLLLK